MKILTVDNEESALNNLNRAILSAAPQAELISFSSASEVLCEIEEKGLRPDIAFLDIEMPSMTGLELTGRIKLSSPFTWIVFVTGYTQYSLEAFSVHAGGYLLKPVTADDICEELEVIGHYMQFPAVLKKRLQVQCFGNFEIFCDGQPLNFRRKKAKELFAYLIHKRGTSCSTREMSAILFEDAPFDTVHKSYLQTIIVNMYSTLKGVGEYHVFIRRYGSIAVDPSQFDCDYYRFLDLDPDSINAYTGEYMNQYEWAELTAGFLSMKSEKFVQE